MTPILNYLTALRATRLGSERIVAPQIDALIAATRDGGVAGFRAHRRASPPRGAVHGGQVVWDALRDLSAATLTAEDIAADGRPGLVAGGIAAAVPAARALWALQQEKGPIKGAAVDWRTPTDWEFSTTARAEIKALAETLVGARA